MTEKRFTFHHDVDGIDYIQDETNGFCFICDKLLCSLLNDLSTENNELKQIIAKDTISRLMNGFEKSYKDLEKENEQLKSIIGKLTLDNTKMKNVLNTTKKENEQLKEEIKDLNDILARYEEKELQRND